MNISLLLIIGLIILLILISRLNFMASDPTQVFLSQTTDVRNVISSVLNDPEYQILINNVPGQKTYNISGNPPTLIPEIIQGDTSKIDPLKNTFPQLLYQSNELINALNNFISMAKNTTGVYTPEKLNSFLVYYNNMLGNITLIKNYLEK